MVKIKMRVFCWLLSMFCAIRTEALGPAMSLVVQLGASVTLPCSVDTALPLHLLEVQWRREESGTLVHMFQEGESRPESQSPAYSGRADFFSEEISKGNFSLLLRNVTTEDKGLYKCVVHTEHESHETEVKIDIGFSTWHLCVLGLTTAAAGFAVLSCIPALLCINKEKKEQITEVKSNTAVLLYCLQVSVPCILMSIAFAIWGYIESSFAEAYTCSAINLTRILVIFKVAPYVFPGKCYKRFTHLALPLENFVIRTGVNSVVLYNLLTYQAPDTARKFFCGFTFALVLLYDLSAVCISGIKFSSGYGYLNYIIDTELFFLIFVRSAYGFTAVFLLWFILPDLKTLLDYLKTDWCSERYEYLGEKVLNVLKYIIDCTFYPLMLEMFSEKDKENPALMCFIVFLYILNAILAFDHRSNLPGVPHILVFVFGSTVLSVLNSAALATEVFLKAEKGKRTVEDLRVFVWPLEFFFLACWLVLQIYAYCMQDEMREQLRLIVQSCKTKGQSPTSSLQNQMPEEALEMLSHPEYAVDMQETPEKSVKMLLQQALEMNRYSEPSQSAADMHELLLKALDIIHFSEAADWPADMQEMPQDAEEMVPLSPPEQSTAHTQETPQDAEEMVLLSPPEQSTAHTQEETDDGLS